jgi:hypothetical protein
MHGFRAPLAGACILVAAAAVPATARAQVGHVPSQSPYRDVTTRQEFTIGGGWFTGNPSEANVGARPGPMAQFRFATRLSGPLDMVVTFALVNSSRYVVNPDSPVTSRTTGPVNYDLVIPDIALGLNLTGRKSWRGVAPYVGMGIGIEMPTAGTTDPGGYEAGSNFTFVPTFGTRVFISRSLALQLEVRDYFIQYEFPLFFFNPNNNAVPPVLDPAKYDEKDMTSNWAFTFGLSYRFNF